MHLRELDVLSQYGRNHDGKLLVQQPKDASGGLDASALNHLERLQRDTVLLSNSLVQWKLTAMEDGACSWM